MYYGILDNNKLVVPIVHFSKESAIEEWAYFENLNINSNNKFLSSKRSKVEICEIVFELNNT